VSGNCAFCLALFGPLRREARKTSLLTAAFSRALAIALAAMLAMAPGFFNSHAIAASGQQQIAVVGTEQQTAVDAVKASPVVPAIVYAGRIAGDARSTRIFLDLDRRVEFGSSYMSRPDRIVIDGPSMLFRFADPSAVEPRGLVSHMQQGAVTLDRSRIVLWLSAPASITAFRTEEIEPGKKWRLVVDLARTTRDEYEAALATQREVKGKSGELVRKGDLPKQAVKKPGRFTVVIDPGHGGIDSGAIGRKGTKEKDLTMAVARKVAADIAKAGPYDVSLTREADVFLSLPERVSFARRAKADLVISIHADSLRLAGMRGASIYRLSEKASDEIAHELAESENLADIVGGVEVVEDKDDVSNILADFTSRETSRYSMRFSETLVSALETQVQMIKNPERHAAFAVLKAPEIPGVLLELGYLSNEEDEKLLTDPQWQERVAELIAKAVHEFFGGRED
jgi:N-acetylmuramoyl-L-alanine amidase